LLAGVAFPNKIISPLSELSVGSDYTIEKKLASANQRVAVVENKEIVLNDSKGPSITDQVGRGAINHNSTILAAFQNPVFTTSSDIHLPVKSKSTTNKPKKTQLLQKLQFD